MRRPGHWLNLVVPACMHLTQAATNLRSFNYYYRFYYDLGTSHKLVYCVTWSQDPSFYCCPRDIECDPASGWEPGEEIEIEIRKLNMYDI